MVPDGLQDADDSLYQLGDFEHLVADLGHLQQSKTKLAENEQEKKGEDQVAVAPLLGLLVAPEKVQLVLLSPEVVVPLQPLQEASLEVRARVGDVVLGLNRELQLHEGVGHPLKREII